MTPGDLVSVKLMPDLGTGLVEFVVPPPFDRVVVSFEVGGKPYREDFAASELQPAKPKVTRTA